MRHKNLDKFKGCLIGGAAGDALGYAVEDSLTWVRVLFGGASHFGEFEKIMRKAIENNVGSTLIIL